MTARMLRDHGSFRADGCEEPGADRHGTGVAQINHHQEVGMDSHSQPDNPSSVKRCTWCGAEYPEDLMTCPIDRNPLSSMPAPSPQSGHGRRRRPRTPLFELWPSNFDALGGVWMRSLMLACCLCYGAKLWAIEHRIGFPRGAETLGLWCSFVLWFSSLCCIGWNSRLAITGIVISSVGLGLSLMLPALAR